jgi:ankyrin repeat protein
MSKSPLSAAERALALAASACSFDTRRAEELLRVDPALARFDLATACVSGEAEAVARWLAADPAAARRPLEPRGWEPILYATFSRLLRTDPERAAGIREVARVLLAAGADPNAYWVTDEDWLQVALYGAAGIAGDVELTRMLLEAGANPTDEREDLDGNEVLYHSVEHRDPTCAMLVVDAGSKQEFVNHAVGRALNFPNHEMVAMLCTHGAQPHSGHLHQAVWRRRPTATVSVLLDAGAPIDEPDEHGLTPLQVALLWGDQEVAALLRARGAAEPVEAVTRTPALRDEMLILAVQRGDLEAVRELLDAGARVDGNPDTKEDPLGQACWRGRVAIVRELLARGANTELPDGGSAIGAALHGSRHCHDPEGGPTMATQTEIPSEPYAEIMRLLRDAGTPTGHRAQ